MSLNDYEKTNALKAYNNFFENTKLKNVFGENKNWEAMREAMVKSCPMYIPTGYDELDRVLNGGLTSSLYVLGAMTSLGKSTFLINLSEKIAGKGIPVLYFSLEMSADHITRGTVCRCLLKAGSPCGSFNSEPKTAAGVGDFINKKALNGMKISAEIWEKAVEKYNTISENFYIIERNEDNPEFTAETVCKFADEFYLIHNNFVLIIDYLQLLQPEENMASRTERSIVDHNISELWKTAHELKIPVIVISSTNRASYTGDIGLDSFKESGGIEFSADVVLGLQYKGAGAKDFDLYEARKAETRKIELKVLKNRYGSVGTIGYDFHAKYGFFEPNKEALNKADELMPNKVEPKPKPDKNKNDAEIKETLGKFGIYNS